MARKVLLGMLLLGALFVFGLATFYVENWQRYLGKGYRLRASFALVHALDEGDVVRMAGVEVGAVEDLRIDTEAPAERQVEATLRIKKDIKVRAEDKAIVKMSSVFGGNYIAIESGERTAAVLGDGDEMTNTAVAPSITEVAETARATLSEIKEGFDKAFEEIASVTKDLREGEGALALLLTDKEFGEKVRGAVDGLSKAAGRLEEGQGMLGKLVMDDQLAADLGTLTADAKELTANLKNVSKDLRDGKGTIGKLLTDEELYGQVKESMGTISDAAALFKEGKGALPMLLEDEKVAEDVRLLVADARKVSAKLTDTGGTLGKLLASDEAYERLMSALDDLGKTTAAIAEGRGTVGKLVMSDELYGQIAQLMQDIQGIVDAYREQSPVVTLGGALFGAF